MPEAEATSEGSNEIAGSGNFFIYVISLPIICAAANLGFYTYRICIEKDWIIVLANNDNEWLANSNSVISQIDVSYLYIRSAPYYFVYCIM